MQSGQSCPKVETQGLPVSYHRFITRRHSLGVKKTPAHLVPQAVQRNYLRSGDLIHPVLVLNILEDCSRRPGRIILNFQKDNV